MDSECRGGLAMALNELSGDAIFSETGSHPLFINALKQRVWEDAIVTV